MRSPLCSLTMSHQEVFTCREVFATFLSVEKGSREAQLKASRRKGSYEVELFLDNWRFGGYERRSREAVVSGVEDGEQRQEGEDGHPEDELVDRL
jgi:hypothetical protein